jgi:hypothetical protein
MYGRKKIGNYPLRIFCSFLYSIILIFGSVFFLYPEYVHAATLSVSPSSGTYKIGQSFSVTVAVGSSDQSMNAVQGVVSFPSDILQVSSVSRAGSIMSMWVADPSYSNTGGTVSFEGVVYNPGYTGSYGKIMTITFRARAAGTATVRFSNGVVLANDGQGTNITTGTGSARFTISAETYTPPVSEAAPGVPTISSDTHPDQTRWYQSPIASFTWTMPNGATDASFVLDTTSDTIPDTVSEGKVSSHVFDRLETGHAYFHVRVKNAGGWSETAHYPLNIDVTPLAYFDISELTRVDESDPTRVRFAFDAADNHSGIDYYEVFVDNTYREVWRDDGNHVYTTSTPRPGLHVLTVRAYDRAGNFLTDMTSYEIAPRPIREQIQDVVTSTDYQAVKRGIIDLFREGGYIRWIIIGAVVIPSILLSILIILLIVRTWYACILLRAQAKERKRERRS